jgi:ribosome-associated protein
MPETKKRGKHGGGNDTGAAKEPISSTGKAVLMAHHAAEYKGLDVVLLDVTGLSSFADYFIVCSGKSSRQVQGIADNLEKEMKEQGLKPLGIEGRRDGQWILMDYGDVIIHIFYEPVRYLYDLESLWSDARKVQWEESPA